MNFTISILVLAFIIILILPFKKLFPNREFRKFINSTRPQEQTKNGGEEFIWGYIAFCGSAYKNLKIKLNNANKEKIEAKLKTAGYYERITAEDFYGTKIITAVILLIVFALFMFTTKNFIGYLMFLVTPLLGYIYPDVVLKSRIEKRKLGIKNELPSILNTLAIVTDAGLNINDAIKRISETKKGYLAYEFSKVMDEVNLGGMFKEALFKMSENCQVPELDTFVFLIVNNMEKGADGLTKVLKEQASETWAKRRDFAKELAEKASIKLFLPMMIFAFPSYLMFIMGPSIISIIEFLK